MARTLRRASCDQVFVLIHRITCSSCPCLGGKGGRSKRNVSLIEILHGGVTQSMRERVLDNFRQGRTRCIVATDVAARGIDVPDVQV